MAKNWNDTADLKENQPIRDAGNALRDGDYFNRTKVGQNWEIRSDYLRFICKSQKVFASEPEAWAEWWTPQRRDYYRL